MKKFIIFITILIVLIISFAITSSAHCVNLFNPDNFYSEDYITDSFSFINNGDGTFTLNGTLIEQEILTFIPNKKCFVLPSGIYLGHLIAKNGIQFYIFDENQGKNVGSTSNNAFIKYVFNSDAKLRSNFLVSAGTYDNVIVKPVLFRLDIVDFGSPDTYEDYVEIYKGSDDYAAALEASKNEGYIAGETEGFEEGKIEGYKSGKNDGYSLGAQNGELVGYIDGYKAGYENFNLSTEYRLENEKQYSNGFAAGVESVKQEQRDNTLLILVPSVVVCGVIAITVILIKSKKKKR